MQYIIGIDVSKNSFTACLVNSEGKVLLKPKKLPLSEVGIKGLIENIPHEIDLKEVMFGLESTGHYWLNLYESLIKKGLKVVVLNPLMVHALKNQGIRGRKTDKDDCILVAKVITLNQITYTHIPDEDIHALRELTRLRSDFTRQIADIKRKVISILDRIFPEYDRYFYNVFGTTSLRLLKEITTPEEFLKIDINKITGILQKESRKQFGRKEAKDLKKLAQNSFGVRFARDAFALELRYLVSQITFLTNMVKDMEKKIKKRYQKMDCFLTTIPGIGDALAATINSEIGDIQKFKGKDGAQKLVAFAGMDPRIRESGQYFGKARLSKRGSRYLRTALYLAANSGRSWDPMFQRIYERQIKRGKHHKVAVIAVANKMLHVIYSVLVNRKPYTPVLTTA